MKYLELFESYCKVDNVDKKFLGYKYSGTKNITHKWDLIKIGKFLSNDKDDMFMVKFKCSECGITHKRQFADWKHLLKIGVPVEVLEDHNDKTYDYRDDHFADNSEELNPPIPTTFTEETDLY